MEEATVTCFIPKNINHTRLFVYHYYLHSSKGEYLIRLTLLVFFLVGAFCFCDHLPNSCYSHPSTLSFSFCVLSFLIFSVHKSVVVCHSPPADYLVSVVSQTGCMEYLPACMRTIAEVLLIQTENKCAPYRRELSYTERNIEQE